MDNLTELRIEYKYYNKIRATPIFIANDELLSFTFNEFYGLVLKEVPYLQKVTSESMALRFAILDENNSEVDISNKYFSSQMFSFVNKGMKVISIRVAVSESPIAAESSSMSAASKVRNSNEVPQSKRCLNLQNTVPQSTVSTNILSGNGNTNTINSNVNAPACIADFSNYNLNQISIVNTTSEMATNCANEDKVEGPPPVLLPLERYAKKQAAALKNYSDELAMKRKELEELDFKLQKASDQNRGHLNTCGNCHLKIGHTRKACDFSPSRSAFSCGVLSKHNDLKSRRASLVKNISQLESKLTTANKDVANARAAVDKVQNSSQKKIEDILLDEQPHRYVMNGLRNWLQLNRDVALLQSKLKGTLPTRNNVMSLLRTVVIDSSLEQKQTSTTTKRKSTATGLRDTDHRMFPQKRILETDYGIVFPSKNSRSEEGNVMTSSVSSDNQQISDFKLALQLQQDELEHPLCDGPLSSSLVRDYSTSCNTNTTQCTQSDANSCAENTAAAALLSLKSSREQTSE